MRRALAISVCLCGVSLILLLSSHTQASVEEQRNRLPPPARECQDPVAGVWMGHTYLNGAWHKFTLSVRREEPGSEGLLGNIRSHVWMGDVEDPNPPVECDPENTHLEYYLDQPSLGSYRNNRIEFTGQSAKLDYEVCGVYSGYYPDSFSGELIYEGTEFHTTNDDGFNPVHTVVFRRVRCGDERNEPIPELPEEEAPPRYSSGCGGCF